MIWFKKYWLPTVTAACVLAMGLVLAIISEESGVSPDAVTTTHMYVIRSRIFKYIEEHGRLPESLAQLSDSDGKGTVNKDGWNANIIYHVDSNGVITLKSIGGGVHHEIIDSFPTKDSNGRWRKGLGADY